jgi:hypothetical protein
MESMEVKAPSYFSKLDMKKEEEKELVVRLSARGKLMDEPTRSQGRFNEFLFTMTTGHNLPDEYRPYLPPEEDETPSEEEETGLEEPPKQQKSRNESSETGQMLRMRWIQSVDTSAVTPAIGPMFPVMRTQMKHIWRKRRRI